MLAPAQSTRHPQYNLTVKGYANCSRLKAILALYQKPTMAAYI